MSVRVVAVSHASGAQGEQVGQVVAERLGFRYVDSSLVAEAAERRGVSPEVVADAERRKTVIARLVEDLGSVALASSFDPNVLVLRAQLPRNEELVRLIRAVIEETVEEGNAVIVAHAASIAVGPRADVLRVLVTGTPEMRARRLADAGDTESVKSHDDARAHYLRKFYGVERELPTHYDLVVNTDLLGPERAVAAVLAAAT